MTHYKLNLHSEDAPISVEATEYEYVQVPTNPTTADSPHAVMFRLKREGDIVFETTVGNINFWKAYNE